MILFNKYKCIRQHDINDCGVACLATVCREYGLKVSIGKIRQVSGTDKEGTSAYGIIKAAESLGFTAKGVIASNPEEILSYISNMKDAFNELKSTLLLFFCNNLNLRF